MDIPDRGIVSEDLSFCIRWRTRCEGQVWASIGHRISHVGPYDYGARYLDVVESLVQQAAVAEPVKEMTVEELASIGHISLMPAA